MASSSIFAGGPELAPVIACLHAACFGDAWEENSVAALLASPGCAALVADSGTTTPEPAGFLIYRSAGEEAEIISVGVLPRYRRLGIASSLLANLTGSLRQNGVGTLFLEVSEANSAALALYHGSGFANVGQREGYYSTGNGNALVLRADFS